MGLREGTYELGPDRGRLLVRTSRTGLGRGAGHDLTIEAARWSGTARVAGSVEGSAVEVAVEVGGLEVREGTGGVRPLSDSDRADITKNLRRILNAGRHPTITFRSTRVEGTPEEFTVEGDLTIGGRTERAVLRATVTGDDRLRGHATIEQPRWGIKPYSAFLGALKLAPAVEVAFDVTL